MISNIGEIIKTTIRECEELTGIKCTVPIEINKRLSKALGRSCAMVKRNRYENTEKVIPTKIELSVKFLQVCTEEELKDVIRHEYAHYCSYYSVGLHTHTTREFIKFCNMMETSHATSKSLTNKIQSKYTLFCSCCGKEVGSTDRKTKMIKEIFEDKERRQFLSGCCHSKLNVTQNY